MHENRRTQFLKLITDAKFKPEQAAFVTAFQSREHGAFTKTVASLAWGSLCGKSAAVSKFLISGKGG